MSEDQPPSSTHTFSWIERLSNTLSGRPTDRDQIIEFLRAGMRSNLIDIDALTMIEGVLQVSEMQVRDTMIPRPQMVVLDEESDLRTMLEVVVESGHSRFPVISNKKDQIVGVVLAKDLLRLLVTGSEEDFELDDIMRPATFVPESKRLNVLLKEFRESRQHMAVVIDEYSAVAGLVTIEDVLEQIVGEIDDEHDDVSDVDRNIYPKDDGLFSVKALTTIEDFNDYFGVSVSDAEFDTIGGLVIQSLGRMPRNEDMVEVQDFKFIVKKADTRRVHLLELHTDKQPLVESEKA